MTKETPPTSSKKRKMEEIYCSKLSLKSTFAILIVPEIPNPSMIPKTLSYEI